MKIALLVTLLLAVGAHAQSLEEKAAWKKAETKIDEYVQAMNGVCKTTVKFEIDKKTFKGDEIAQIANFTWAATEALDSVCRNVEGGPEAVKEKIKVVKVTKGAAHKFALKAGVVTYTTSLAGGSADPRDAMIDWLKKNL